MIRLNLLDHILQRALSKNCASVSLIKYAIKHDALGVTPSQNLLNLACSNLSQDIFDVICWTLIGPIVGNVVPKMLKEGAHDSGCKGSWLEVV
jgi:hypothetical protein